MKTSKFQCCLKTIFIYIQVTLQDNKIDLSYCTIWYFLSNGHTLNYEWVGFLAHTKLSRHAHLLGLNHLSHEVIDLSGYSTGVFIYFCFKIFANVFGETVIPTFRTHRSLWCFHLLAFDYWFLALGLKLISLWKCKPTLVNLMTLKLLLYFKQFLFKHS